MSIGSYPDGVNDATSITVPSGEAISGIELSLDESVLPVSAAKMFDSPADYDHSMAVYDGMDVNNSVLQLLPQGWTYDMEGTNLFTFSGNNVWFGAMIPRLAKPMASQAEQRPFTPTMEIIQTTCQQRTGQPLQ